MNPYKKFINFLPLERMDVGKIIAVQSNTVSVLLQNGNKVRVVGEGVIGDNVYVKGGAVVGTAPDLPGQDIEIL